MTNKKRKAERAAHQTRLAAWLFAFVLLAGALVLAFAAVLGITIEK